MNKYCAKCKTTKCTEEFYRNVSRHDKLSVYCKKCQNEYAKELAASRINNPVKVLEKFCPSCKVVKYPNQFSRVKTSHCGLNSYCRVCQNKLSAPRRRAYQKSHREQDRIKSQNRRSRKANAEGTYTIKEIKDLLNLQGGVM